MSVNWWRNGVSRRVVWRATRSVRICMQSITAPCGLACRSRVAQSSAVAEMAMGVRLNVVVETRDRSEPLALRERAGQWAAYMATNSHKAGHVLAQAPVCAFDDCVPALACPADVILTFRPHDRSQTLGASRAWRYRTCSPWKPMYASIYRPYPRRGPPRRYAGPNLG